jgi:hypothetical protein
MMHEDKLILAQVDHASNEIIGQAVQDLIHMGVKNVQLLNSITKKGRPSYLLLIDLPKLKIPSVAVYLAAELGIWGYHIMESQHIHFDISFKEKTLQLASGNKNATYRLRPKYIKQNDHILYIKLDHSQLLEIQRQFNEWELYAPLQVFRSHIEAKLWSIESDTLCLRAEDLLSNYHPEISSAKTSTVV